MLTSNIALVVLKYSIVENCITPTSKFQFVIPQGKRQGKGKDHCRVYCVAAHYGSFSVIKQCLCKRWKPPSHF